MLILLPPSEGKTAPSDGVALDHTRLDFPELTPWRDTVLTELGALSARQDALELLGVGPSLTEEVQRNLALRQEPSGPAHEVYTGVLYEALGFRTLTRAQQSKACSSVLIMSALWGVVGFGNEIPAYRLSMSAKLPELGRLAAWWKPRLSPVLDERSKGELIIDCRSGTYAAAWTPPPQRTVTVNVFQMRGGKRTVVSHFAKHTRGELVRHVLQRRGKGPTTARALAEVAAERWETELVAPEGRKPYRLNLVLPGD